MIQIVLYRPEIPQNTGNIIRLCANTGAGLHLIEPLGFELTDKHLKRAGLDYHDKMQLCRYPDWDTFISERAPVRLFACETGHFQRYDEIAFCEEDYILFGRETTGLPQRILDFLGEKACFRLPMRTPDRSLNLANTVAIVAYEAWRQIGFETD